jgi:hypothetical protein
MARLWVRDIAYALLRLGWSAKRQEVLSELKQNAHTFYPSANRALDKINNGRSDNFEQTVNGTFSRHCCDSSAKAKSPTDYFIHGDGGRGHWELLYYDINWDGVGFNQPHGGDYEYERIDNLIINPTYAKELLGFGFEDSVGEVYIIKNKAWKDWYKIGKTTNFKLRISTYRTGDPHREYELVTKKKFVNCGTAELQAQRQARKIKIDEDHEWFKIKDESEVKKLLDNI